MSRIHNVFYLSCLKRALGQHITPSFDFPPLDDDLELFYATYYSPVPYAVLELFYALLERTNQEATCHHGSFGLAR